MAVAHFATDGTKATHDTPAFVRYRAAILSAFVALGAPLCFGQAPVLNVEIVNDSGKSDSEVYVLLTGSNITPVGGGPLSNLIIPAVDLAASPAPTNTVVCAALSTLPVSTNIASVVSTLSGRTNAVRVFSMETIKSARLFVSYSPSLQFVGLTAPTNIEGYRFDKCEFDFSGPPTWAANLTSVDFVGVPLRLEAVDSTSEEPFDARSFYLSKETLVNRLAAQIALNNGSVGTVIQRDASNNFLRIISPATLTANNATGSASPYPSFLNYLNSLVATNYVIQCTGTSAFGAIGPTWVNDQTNNVVVNIPTYQATYNYSGPVTQTTNGFLIKLTGTMSNWSTNNASNLPVPIPVPSMFQTVTTNITYTGTTVLITNMIPTVVKAAGKFTAPQIAFNPVVTTFTTFTPITNIVTNAIGTNITLLLPYRQMDENIYGCPLTTESFCVTNPSLTYPGSNCTTTAAQTSYFNAVLGNTIYSYVVADVQSGLNFGYLNGKYGNNTSNWFRNILPPSVPFGAGRNTNDGFYNPYTALLFNASDAYGFAFNDRSVVGTNPLMSYDSSDTHMRVTVLPDNQIDAPEVTAAANSQGTLLSWPTVANVPSGYTLSYLINSYPPLTNAPVTATGNSQLVNIPSGVPYTFSVVANAVSPGGTLTNQSYAIPIQATAPGSFVLPAGTYTNQFTPAGWAVKVFSDPSQYPIAIGGQSAPFVPGITNYTPALLTGNAGTNYYPIVVSNSGGTPVYQNVIEFVMAASTNGSGGAYYLPQAPELPGNSLPLSIAPPIPAVFPLTYPQGPWSNAASFYPTISIPGQPESFKIYAPAIFPPAPPTLPAGQEKPLFKTFYK